MGEFAARLAALETQSQFAPPPQIAYYAQTPRKLLPTPGNMRETPGNMREGTPRNTRGFWFCSAGRGNTGYNILNKNNTNIDSYQSVLTPTQHSNNYYNCLIAMEEADDYDITVLIDNTTKSTEKTNPNLQSDKETLFNTTSINIRTEATYNILIQSHWTLTASQQQPVSLIYCTQIKPHVTYFDQGTL
jgi:hypothetical protein